MSQAGQKRNPDEGAVEEDAEQYGSGPISLADLGAQFPNRPRNHSRTLFFHELCQDLLSPLDENYKQPAAGRPNRRGGGRIQLWEPRRRIIERFVARWRNEVGPDFYPAMRIMLPGMDGDRGLYGLKESIIGKLLVKIMKISKSSEDGHALVHWKLPDTTMASRVAGDFAGQCFQVLSKRPMSSPGDMRIAEVNVLLDRLAGASGEAEQLPILETFYRRMNADEMMWLMRILLKQMKVGATQRIILNVWHPDAEALFSASTSLRRVCWELHDRDMRLRQEEKGVTLMQCFQPQLAQFQTTTFAKMMDKLGVTDEDPEFWIEEKLDGERMQMHMQEDESLPGGFRFAFWSRKGKDYSYLYGTHLEDADAALTRDLKTAFGDGVRNLVLDGEMTTWDPETDKMLPFGTLKTAALAQQRRPEPNSPQPLFRVFDMVLLNDTPITKYTLRDRIRALERAVKGEPRRLEIHGHMVATSADAVEPALRKVVAEASEGLVLKSPRSMYRLNSRNDDWIKVKPEYMLDFGESLDCVVIGGYFGSGHRGGTLSSFLCGLRARGANAEKCLSFCKVGGGFRAEDYAAIRHHTEGNWKDWMTNPPAAELIQLSGGAHVQHERPDVWIRPSQSVVISIKAASIGRSDHFATGVTLRFPRFRALRLDRDWDSGLDVDGLETLRCRLDEEAREKSMDMDKRRRPAKRVRRERVIAGADTFASPMEPDTRVMGDRIFEGMTFCVLSDAMKPPRKPKSQIEQLIKNGGGRITQRPNKDAGTVIVADRKVIRVAGLMKQADLDIVRPRWIMDCLAQSGGKGFLLPYEEHHLLHATESTMEAARANSDCYGDSYARDVDAAELGEILNRMPKIYLDHQVLNSVAELGDRLERSGYDIGSGLKGWTFRRCCVCLVSVAHVPDTAVLRLRTYVRFGGGRIVDTLVDADTTHIVVLARDGENDARSEMAANIRCRVASQRPMPRLVSQDWIELCWKEATLLDEERFAIA